MVRAADRAAAPEATLMPAPAALTVTGAIHITGGITATLKEIVRSGSDEARMPTATPLVWALIVVRLAALTGPAEAGCGYE